jgi:hypothetical protein
VAYNFLVKAFDPSYRRQCVLWNIYVDPRGATELMYRCKQARARPHCTLDSEPS